MNIQLANRHPLIERIFSHLSANPSHTAYQYISNTKVHLFTNGQVLQKSIAVANSLQIVEKKFPKKALLVFNPGLDFISSLLGCMLANVIATPIPIPKPRTRELFQYFLHHLQPDFLFTNSELAPRVHHLLSTDEELGFNIIQVDQLASEKVVLENPAGQQDIALIQYTSGTTHHPKGVVITYDNLLANLIAIQQHFGLSNSSTTFSWLPHYHDMGLVDGLLTPLFNQCTGILTSPYQVVSSPISWLKAIEKYQVTHTGCPNFILDLCVDKIPKNVASQLNLQSLSHLYVSAEPVRKKTLERFASHFRKAGFKPTMFTPGYGLAEATLMVTCKNPGEDLKIFFTQHGEYVSLGNPIPKLELKIIDSVSAKILPEGEIGEVIISGPTIMKGYYQDAKKNQQVFLELDGIENKTYLRTGDLGFMQKGELAITGRIKDTLIVYGTQYHAEDLEYVVADTCIDFMKSGCAVFSIEFDGTEQPVVIQEVKRNAVHAPGITAKKGLIQDALFNYFGLKAYDILMVRQGSIPKTTSGKIRRVECKNLYLRGQFNFLP